MRNTYIFSKIQSNIYVVDRNIVYCNKKVGDRQTETETETEKAHSYMIIIYSKDGVACRYSGYTLDTRRVDILVEKKRTITRF